MIFVLCWLDSLLLHVVDLLKDIDWRCRRILWGSWVQCVRRFSKARAVFELAEIVSEVVLLLSFRLKDGGSFSDDALVTILVDSVFELVLILRVNLLVYFSHFIFLHLLLVLILLRFKLVILIRSEIIGLGALRFLLLRLFGNENVCGAGGWDLYFRSIIFAVLLIRNGNVLVVRRLVLLVLLY